MRKYDPACVTGYPWYRGVGILDPRARWVPPLGPVGTPDTYLHKSSNKTYKGAAYLDLMVTNIESSTLGNEVFSPLESDNREKRSDPSIILSSYLVFFVKAPSFEAREAHRY